MTFFDYVDRHPAMVVILAICVAGVCRAWVRETIDYASDALTRVKRGW